MLENKKNKQKFWVVIPCGGSGSRAKLNNENSEINSLAKQYQEIAGFPLVLHTIRAFLKVEKIDKILINIQSNDNFLENYFQQNSEIFKNNEKDKKIIVLKKAGKTRAETVKNALEELINQGAKFEDWILVHDAVRCLITENKINNLIKNCENDEVGGILAVPVPDTLKLVENNKIIQTLNRENKFLAQTPQMFRIGILKKALEQKNQQNQQNKIFTDESSAVESLGFKPKIILGSSQNFKITFPEDFKLAENLLIRKIIN